MSFIVNGTTFYEPSDFSLITNPVSIDGMMAYKGNLGYRLDKSAVSLAGHNHVGEFIQPTRIWSSNSEVLSIEQRTGYHVLIGCYPRGASLYLNAATGVNASGGYIRSPLLTSVLKWTADGRVSIGGSVYGSYGLTIQTNTDNYGKGIADAWMTYACSRASKSSIAPVPATLIDRVTGVTFVDSQNRPGTGVVAEDLDATGLPGAVDKDPDTGEYLGINTTVLIAPLVNADKELRQQVNTLTDELALIKGRF